MNQLGRKQTVRATDLPGHRFVVGQTVRLKGGVYAPGQAANVYKIVAALPPRDNSAQYRIRNESERHERVTTEDNLEPHVASASDGDAGLAERTFG